MPTSRHLLITAASALICLGGAAPAASAAPADLDGSWSGDGIFSSSAADLEPKRIAVAPDGRVTVASTTYGATHVLRLLASGEPDPSFGGGDGVAT
jgi:hypothetical protein